MLHSYYNIINYLHGLTLYFIMLMVFNFIFNHGIHGNIVILLMAFFNYIKDCTIINHSAYTSDQSYAGYAASIGYNYILYNNKTFKLLYYFSNYYKKMCYENILFSSELFYNCYNLTSQSTSQLKFILRISLTILIFLQ